jgi:hypothetical protein
VKAHPAAEVALNAGARAEQSITLAVPEQPGPNLRMLQVQILSFFAEAAQTQRQLRTRPLANFLTRRSHFHKPPSSDDGGMVRPTFRCVKSQIFFLEKIMRAEFERPKV